MPEYIKDTECSRDTPVIWGKLSDRSYGTGKRIKPNIDGKHATDYEKKNLFTRTAAAPLLAEADKSLREVTAVHINIDPTEASELGEMIANSLRNGSSMLRGGA